jgi:hypothetical protein
MLHRTRHPLTLAARRVRSTTRLLIVASLLGLLLALSATARAAQPTVEQCLQASDLSLELETQEKLLATRDALKVCASLGCPPEVRDECARRIELVEHNIPRVFCEVRDETGRVRHDALLTIDGRAPAVAAEQLLELEPGSHTLTAQASGMLPKTLSVNVRARDRERRVVFLLQRAASRLGPRRVAALVTGGVGVAALATATVFAVVALDRKQDARALCPSPTCPSSLGAERWDSARQAGNFSTGFLVGGVLALGVAGALWFSFESRATEVAVGPAGVLLKARF